MTTLALSRSNSRPTRGESDASNFVAGQFVKERQRLQNSYSLGLGARGIFEDLFLIAGETNSPNWDGYGAKAVAAETFRLANSFLQALPLGMPPPSVGAEPDGELTLEWHYSPRRTLSVSVAGDGDLHYAALLGPGKAYGTEPFFGEVPKPILELISRVYLG